MGLSEVFVFGMNRSCVTPTAAQDSENAEAAEKRGAWLRQRRELGGDAAGRIDGDGSLIVRPCGSTRLR